LYIWLKKRMSTNSAASLTMIASLLVVIIPLTLVVLLATKQLVNLSDGVTQLVKTLDINQLGTHVIETTNRVLDGIPFVNAHLTDTAVVDGAKHIVQTLGQTLLGYFTGLITSFVGFITTSIVFIFVLFSLIKHGPMLLDVIKELNPLGDELTDLYLQKIGAMIRGTVQGQFVIAVAQGFLASATIALVGYPELFFVLFIITTALSIVPLGAGILVMPLGVVMALFGNVWGGIIVNLEHLIINTNIDNILRPKLVPKEARLDTALMLVSVFAGISWIGYLGIVIGPTLMILIVTTVQVYLDVQKDYQSVTLDDTGKHYLTKKLRSLSHSASAKLTRKP
ncbi:AI-2E family transporter, partial [Candidatus Saccharibacteria bacterium]|nr:AI-2E family transporter [Candidatus Saccharibacteria bacterium]